MLVNTRTGQTVFKEIFEILFLSWDTVYEIFCGIYFCDLSIYLFIYLSINLTIYLSIYLSPIYQISCYTWKELETDLVNPEYQQNIWCLTISEPRSSKMKKENHFLAFLSIFNPNNTNLFSTVCTAWRN